MDINANNFICDNATVIAHLGENLGVNIRWNGLFLCFEIRFPQDGDRWLPASPEWRYDDVHRQLRDLINSHPERRSLGTWKGYDQMLRQLRSHRETQYHPLSDLPSVTGDMPQDRSSLVAHMAAIRKTYRLPSEVPYQRLLTIPHEMPLMPTKWAHLERYAFDFRLLRDVPASWVEVVWRQSNAPGRRVVVLVGTPTRAQLRRGFLCVAEPPDPETAWQEVAKPLGLQQGLTPKVANRREPAELNGKVLESVAA